MSRCNYCRQPILWVPKQGGTGFFRPFDYPEDMARVRYNLMWDGTNWRAEPSDKSKVLSLTVHECQEYEEYLLNANPAPEPVYPTVSLVEGSGDVETVEVIKYKPAPLDPDKLIPLAKKLSSKCSTCFAKPFEWCKYISGASEGQTTTRLHKER